MGKLGDIAREVRGYPLGEAFSRLVDRRPIQCNLYVTDRCNLDCVYCTEYDNSQPHPKLEDLQAWIRKIRSLGTMRIALAGGEPLMHPDIVEVVATCREVGLTPSLTTNGFLLTPELVRDLGEAGLQTMQISVDRMTPSPITRKSFRTVLPKLEYLRDVPFRVHITGVICEDTVDESREVLRTGLERGFPTEVRLVHADPQNRYRVDPADRQAATELLEWMRAAKRRGVSIHTSETILDYQLAALRGASVDWECVAGYKIFFVSAKGQFWLCTMKHTDRHILDVEPEDLLENRRPKPCQEGCGIYCAVSTSMAYANPTRVISREVVARARRVLATESGELGGPVPDES